MQNISRLRCALALLVCLLASPGVRAVVSVAELAQSCRTALADNYQGVAAAACDWFIDPCAVCGVETQALWCVPAGLSAAARARYFLAALAASTRDPNAAAKPIVETILRRAFPCEAAP